MKNKEEILERYLNLTPIKSGQQALMTGGEEGEIEFGEVDITNLPVDAYNQAAFNFKTQMEQELGTDAANKLLINAGHECGYHTLNSIHNSDLYQDKIKPLTEGVEEEAKSLTLAMRAFGMGRYRVVKASEEEAVIRSYGCPEADYYLENNDEADQPQCHMQAGILAAVNNVIFRDGHDQVYEEEPDVFHEDAYFAKETKCRAQGDDYCEWVIRTEFNFNNDQQPPEEYKE